MDRLKKLTNDLYDALDEVISPDNALIFKDIEKVSQILYDKGCRSIIYCKDCTFFRPYDKVEDFDGVCLARECETDKTDFCNWGTAEEKDTNRRINK